MEVLRPTHFSAQYIEFEAPLNEGDHVNGAGMPFSWEKKPGVPLMVSPNYVENIKGKEACELYTHREEGAMLGPNPNSDNSKEKEVCVQNSLQICSNHLLFPLPKPPAGFQTSSPSNTNTTTTNNVSNIKSSTFSSSSSSSAKPHTHNKQRRSLQAFLNNKQAKNITIFMNKADIMIDDPFLKAIEACREPSLQGLDQDGTKVQENSTRETKEGEGVMDASNHGVHKMSSKALLSKLFEEKVLGISKHFDDKVLNSKASLSKLNGGALNDKMLNPKPQSSKLNGAFHDNEVLDTNPQLSKLNGAFDDKVLNANAHLSQLNANPQSSTLNGSFVDKVLNANPHLSKLTYEASFEDNVHSTKSPLSNKLIESTDDMVLNAYPQLSKLNYEAALDDKALNTKPPFSNKLNGEVISANTQVSKFNYEAALDEIKELNSKQQVISKLNYAGSACDNKLHRSPMRSCNMRTFDDKEPCRTPLRKLAVKSEASGKPPSYNGHPAFMVASFHQSPKPKKPITPKPAQARPPHQRSSSYGSYGCLGCTSADHYDSIVRL